MLRLAIVLALLGAAAPAASAADPADLTDYITEIRAQGMSEGARGDLMTLANITLGFSVFEYTEDPQSGRWWKGYRSGSCPLPGADPEDEARRQAELARQRDAEIDRLCPLADADGSGFVSTREGHELRQIFEFGVLVRQVSERHGYSTGAIVRASGLEASAVAERLAAYEEVAARARSAGVTMFASVAGD